MIAVISYADTHCVHESLKGYSSALRGKRTLEEVTVDTES